MSDGGPGKPRRDGRGGDGRRADGPRRDGRGGDGRRADGPRRRSATRPAERSRSTDVPRRLAYDVLRSVDEGAYANIELPRRLRERGLTGRDAAFVTELVYGATRLRGFYDPVIALAAGRPVDRLDPTVLDVLRLGAHQLLGMRVPAHAAADTTVALARETHGPGVGGLVNAVMHRIAERDREQWLAEVGAGRQGADLLAVTTSHPAWQVRALRSALLGHGVVGPEEADAELAGLLAADNTPAAVTLAARPGLTDDGELMDHGGTPGRWAPTAVTLSAGDPGGIPAVRDGRAAVQDEGSQLIALALAGCTPSRPDERWLDLCAGPGGKAGLLAALAARSGVTLFANEISEHRAGLVRRTVAAAAAAGAEVYVGVGDGRDVGDLEPGVYDRILVDAPCTGLGALRRRPEARWRRQESDVPVLTALQGELLDSALRAVRPGGVVLYATCSPHLAETRYVVADALKRAAAAGIDVERLDTQAAFTAVAVEPMTDLGDAPYVQLWPHRHGTDGMFAALLRRVS